MSNQQKQIEVFDTTLRDGLQVEGVAATVDDKLRLLGVAGLQGGLDDDAFAALPEGAVEALLAENEFAAGAPLLHLSSAAFRAACALAAKSPTDRSRDGASPITR